jgi:nucleoside-diphosphate-sugar epimerase
VQLDLLANVLLNKQIKKNIKFRLMLLSIELIDCLKFSYFFVIKVHSLNEPEKVDPVKSFGEVIEGDLDETESLDKACKGVHTIVHMAGNPDPSAKWDELKKANIEG